MAADTVHLLLNPTAGRGRAAKRLDRIVELLSDCGAAIEVHKSRAPRDLENTARSLSDKGADRLVVAGGDGSIHEATNGILSADRQAALGIIPTGTGNDFAKACSIPLNWEHATRLLADRLAANETPRPIDAGRLNDRYFANGAGIGFDAKVTRVARSIHWPIGDIVYLFAVFKTMLDGIATPQVRIETDELIWDGPLTLAAACNGQWVGGMFHIAPTANNADGNLELLIAAPVTRRRILTLLPRLMNGTHLEQPEISTRPVTRLTVTASEPVPAQLDGEVQPLQTVFEIEILPGALNLL